MQHNYRPAGYGQGPKVAISKLDRGPPPPPKLTERSREDRVARACKLCRKRKVRCSGHLPRCTNCQTSDTTCVYDQARRDRLREAIQLNQSLIGILKDMSDRIQEEDRQRIDELLQDAEEDLISLNPGVSIRSLGKRARKESSSEDNQYGDEHGEAHVTASVGSNENLDFLGEDLMRSREARATGYVGQNSEVQWLRSVQRQAQGGPTDPLRQKFGPPGSSHEAIEERSEALHDRRRNSAQGRMGYVTDASFYLDSDDMEVDIAVDPYDIPDPDTAQRLFECYMSTVHGSFPVMPMTFEDQFRRYMESVRRNRPYQVPEKWRATLNLVFAIGARYSHLIQADWRGDERDHLIYMTRAVNLLGLKNTVMIISGPDLGLVQATGALAFYFLVIGHVSRAWVMIGISIRLALALGLHLRNEDPSADLLKREALARTWWSLHMTESLVSSITGRPPVLANEDCTVSFPNYSNDLHISTHNSKRTSRVRRDHGSPQSSGASNTSEASKQRHIETLHLQVSVELSMISQKVLRSLYAPRTAVSSWEDIQKKIKDLLAELEAWAKTSLTTTDAPKSKSRGLQFDRSQFLLQIDYWSTKILITRPCLCRIERRVPHESEKSANLNSKAAGICVQAARALTSLFPDEPDTEFLYAQGPWWSAVHIIMQSTAVLLLEIAYEGEHIRDEEENIVKCLKKMIQWLRAMQANDPVAARAYNVIWTILKNCSPALQGQADELLAEDRDSPGISPQQSSPLIHDGYQQTAPRRVVDHASGQGGFPVAVDPQLLQSPEPAISGLGTEQYPNYDSPPIYQLPMSFGNPFYTSFDQGAPVVNMQNLWMNAPTDTNMYTDFAGMSFQQPSMQQQGYHGAELNTERGGDLFDFSSEDALPPDHLPPPGPL
ncbi:hypothetical protein ACN47E_008548 [Coniothyrium glycines]